MPYVLIDILGSEPEEKKKVDEQAELRKKFERDFERAKQYELQLEIISNIS